MTASRFVGRIGGLAVALGLGTAVFTGSPAAWADGSVDTAAPGGDSTRTAEARGTGPNQTRRTQVRTATRSRAGAAERPAGQRHRPGAVRPVQDPVAAAAPAENALTALRSRRLSAAPNPPAGDTPGAPVESPLPWTALALSRRQAAASTGSLLGSSITVNPEVQWTAGILYGTLNATSGRGLPLSYSVVKKPSLGGKIAWAPSSDGTRTDQFSYLPSMTTLTTPGQNEQFSVLAAEVTPLDTALSSIPLIGDLWDPVLKALHRLPLVNTVLAPLIGGSVVARFDETPAALAAGRPVGFTYMMPSFDGTLISVNYFPAAEVASGAAESAPTVLNGPDLGFPGSIDVYSIWAPSLVGIVPGIPVLRSGVSPFDGGYAASSGFNVITWDPRGEWASGGVLQLDSPFYEARDVSSIISWAGSQANVAQSQVATDAGDPLVGMVGGSYGGGIQLTTAATDPRVDAIVPGIAWNTLNESLYPSNTFKTVIGTELLLALVGTGARINSQIYPAIITGDLFSRLSESAQALLSSAGPGILAGNITAPSLFLQGTVDILFELDAASTNAQAIVGGDASTPAKITWFCGGHGVCLLPDADQQAQGVLNMNDTLRWLDQYVAGNASAGADAIPAFQWYDQAGRYHSSDLSPYDPSFNKPTGLNYTGDGGSLLLVPLLGGSGPSQAAVPPAKPTVFSTAFALASGGKARNALNLNIDPPVGTVIAGAPNLSFSYSGLGTSRAVYAQLVDQATGQVVGNVVTPVPVTLDGRTRSVSIPMADIAYSVGGPSDSMTLQITSSALPYANAFAWGYVTIADVALDVPVVA